jgi:hypothetical protein
MLNPETVNEAGQAIRLLKEQLEIIRVNSGIIEILRKHGRISESDKQYIGICELDQDCRQAFQDFILRDLPVLFKADNQPENVTLKRFFLEWANDLHLRLTILDRMIKDYLNQISLSDRKSEGRNPDSEIRDKRFWTYLDGIEGNPAAKPDAGGLPV